MALLNVQSTLPSTYVEGFHSKELVQQMPYKPLGDTGLIVSSISFGASALGSIYRATDEASSIEVVHKAIKSGINYIDTAPWYGHGKAEMVLGKALKNIPREAYYIATKVCRYEANVTEMFDFTAERTLQSVDTSLQRLGLDYVDVIQIHDMEFAPNLDIILNETLPALQRIKNSGKTRFIGITGYPMDNFKRIIEQSTVRIDTILSYCHLSLNDNSLLDHQPYFLEKGIGVINASPIAMGLLTDRGPPSWHPATDDIKNACKAAAVYCQSKGVDISKLAMHYSHQFDIPTTMFSTASLENLQKNLLTVQETLTQLERQTMKEIIDIYFKPLGNKTWEGVEVQKYWGKRRACEEMS